MQQRYSASARPSGTDGYDFSYRMVVDSRDVRLCYGGVEAAVQVVFCSLGTLGATIDTSGYQKVARTKSILRSFFLVQGITLLLGLVLLIFQSASEDFVSQRPEIATTACGLISLIIGELGRKRSRVNLLKFSMILSSIVVSFLVYCAISKCSGLMAAKSPTYWETVLELPDVAFAFVGLVFHVFIIGYTFHLIANMSPPKRAS